MRPFLIFYHIFNHLSKLNFSVRYLFGAVAFWCVSFHREHAFKAYFFKRANEVVPVANALIGIEVLVAHAVVVVNVERREQVTTDKAYRVAGLFAKH